MKCLPGHGQFANQPNGAAACQTQYADGDHAQGNFRIGNQGVGFPREIAHAKLSRDHFSSDQRECDLRGVYFEDIMFEQLAHSIPYNPNTPATVWLMYLLSALLYCSPILIAFYRNVDHKWWLYFTNLFLGFTGIASLGHAAFPRHDIHFGIAVILAGKGYIFSVG